MIRQGSNQTFRKDRVLKGEQIIVQGSNGTVRIAGDIEGYVSVQGSNPTISVGGRIYASATIILQGSNATLKHHGRDHGASVTLQGSNAEEIDLGDHDGPKSPPDRSGLGTRGFFGSTTEVKEDRRELQVQKSGRPREQWGT